MSGSILIADEAANNRIFLAASLASAGYDVKEATTPEELFGQIKTETPDLIILDKRFGIGGCFENCRVLKSNAQTAGVPLIIVTNDYDSHHRLVALRAGADELLPRPLNEHYLRARIRNLLRVKNLNTELRQRETTALELGFSETASIFAPQTDVLVVEATQSLPGSWITALADMPNTSVTTTTEKRALDLIEKRGLAPELIILAPGLHKDRMGMTLVPELRTRALTRHAAIMVIHEPSERLTAVTALDLGANDLVETDCTSAEIRYRLRFQLDLLKKSRRLRSTLERGLQMAITDPLTGLFNRRYAMPHLARISRAAEEKEQPFAVMVLDLDHFKRINDTHGHAAGDAVLKGFSDRLRENLRNVDMIARIGGEEFLVVMPDTDFGAAKGAAERLRRLVEATPFTLRDGQ